MIGWIKNINKPFPEFWKKYLAKFDEKSNEYIALSLETSGLNSEKDLILSFGAISIVNDNIIIGNSFETIILRNQEENSQHKTEQDVIESFINFIGNSTLVGHRIYFDVDIINVALDKLDCGRLKNEALDIEIMYKKLLEINDKNFALDELNTIFKIPKSERVSSSEDAFSIALLFLKLKSRLGLK